MDLGLKDKRALVIGASRGLGYATAHQLAAEGCKVVVVSRDETTLLAAAERIRSETGGQVFAIPADATAPNAGDQIVVAAVEVLCRSLTGTRRALDILVTNAGGPPAGMFASFTDADWSKAIEASLMSHVRLIRAALPFLRKSESPSVLTVTSYSVKQPIPGLVLSNSVRLATIGLTKTLAIELGKDRIRFNSILPGWTETERVAELMAARSEQYRTTVKRERAKQAADIPLGRMGRPEEFARVAAFLVSPAASYVNGVMLPVDGGIVKSTL